MKFMFIIIISVIALTHLNAQENNKTIILKLKNGNDRTKLDIENTFKVNLIPVFNKHNQQRNTKQSTRLSNIYAIKTSATKQKKLLSFFTNHTDIAYIEYKPEVQLFDTPNDPSINSQYYIDLINMPDAWDVETGDSTVIIAIVDSGTDLTHEDLQDKIALNLNDPINGIDDDQDGFTDNYYGWDLSENNNNPQYDANFHGAKVAGIVAAATNNAIGVAGVGFNLKFLPVKTMNAQGDLNTAWEGIIYAADQGADVIVCSWGGIAPSAFGRDIVQYATLEKGAIIVAASGNNHEEWLFYPACYPEVLSVTATNENDQKWVGNNGSGSTYGYTIDIAAPGQNIYNLTANNSYGPGTGTSYAAPIVGAIAGLVKSFRPHLNANQIKQQILNTTYLLDTIPQNVIYKHKLGSGRIDGYAALMDTLISGIDLTDIEFSGNRKPGDTVYFTGVFTNHLQSALINIEIESLHEAATPLNNTINAGIINSGNFYEINNNSLPIVLSENIDFDQNVTLKFTINDGSRNYYRLASFMANTSYEDLNENNLNATIASNGRIGFAELDPVLGNGIWLDNSRNMVWEAGLIYGNSSTQTISTFLDASGLSIQQVIKEVTDLNGNTFLYTEMADSNKSNSMDIYVKKKVIALNREEMNNTLFFEYTLINNSNNTYDNFHAGLFFDWDINPLENNHTYFDNENQIAISENVVGNSRLFGVKISNTPFKQYAFELNDETEGINITDGFTSEERWFALTTERQEAGLSTGDDIAHMVSTNELALEAGDSLILKFIVTSANHESEIIEQITQGEQYLNDIENITNTSNRIHIFPNPFTDAIQLSATFQIENILIYNSNGQLVKQIESKSSELKINLNELKAGLYFIEINTKNSTKYIQKIIKQ